MLAVAFFAACACAAAALYICYIVLRLVFWIIGRLLRIVFWSQP